MFYRFFRGVFPFFLFFFIPSCGVLNDMEKNKDQLSLMEGKLDVLQERISNCELKVSSLEIDESWKDAVFLSEEDSFQRLSSTYNVSIEQVQEYLTGLKIKGRMLNTSSVSCEVCTFKIIIQNSEKEFVINKILPAQASQFEVYVPQVTKDSSVAKIKYQNGMLKYY